MNRRDFIRATGFGAALIALNGQPLSIAAPQVPKRRKPNLLFIWTDQQRADTMAVYGNTNIHVPNLNRLASESVVFKRAYVTFPVCTPSRGSVMTGLWPHSNGLTANNIPLRKETPCFPEMIDDPEYRTAYMGKWHLGDEIFVQHGFEEWVSIEDMYAEYYTEGRDRNARSDYYQFLVSSGHKPPKGISDRYYSASLPFDLSKPKFLERKAIDFLKRHREEPFMLYVNFLEPHPPVTGPFNNEYDPASVTLPENFNDPLEENEPKGYRARREQFIKNYGSDEASYRKLIAKYWGLVTEVDTCVGGILKTLDELGLADNTIVVFTSDHGDMMGSHRMVEKCVMYEEAVRVPLLMRVPWLGKKQRIIKQPVSQIDLVPTLLDIMNQDQKSQSLQGNSLVPLMNGGKPAEDNVFIEWHPRKNSDLNFYVRTIISPDGWKLSLFKNDKCQLFDLNNDPYETTNLFDSGKHEDKIRELTKKIQDWQKRTNDVVNFEEQSNN
jgi:choline-sulfatase